MPITSGEFKDFYNTITTTFEIQTSLILKQWRDEVWARGDRVKASKIQRLIDKEELR